MFDVIFSRTNAADVRRHIVVGNSLLHPQNMMQMDATDASPQTVSFSLRNLIRCI